MEKYIFFRPFFCQGATCSTVVTSQRFVTSRFTRLDSSGTFGRVADAGAVQQHQRGGIAWAAVREQHQDRLALGSPWGGGTRPRLKRLKGVPQ